MRTKLRSPSPAFVIACLALFLSLGPAVKAANSILSADIVDGEVKTPDLATGAVTFQKLAPNSATKRSPC